jgi:hypothetical protein
MRGETFFVRPYYAVPRTLVPGYLCGRSFNSCSPTCQVSLHDIATMHGPEQIGTTGTTLIGAGLDCSEFSARI